MHNSYVKLIHLQTTNKNFKKFFLLTIIRSFTIPPLISAALVFKANIWRRELLPLNGYCPTYLLGCCLLLICILNWSLILFLFRLIMFQTFCLNGPDSQHYWLRGGVLDVFVAIHLDSFSSLQIEFFLEEKNNNQISWKKKKKFIHSF